MKNIAQDFITISKTHDLGDIHLKKDVFNSIAVYACQEETRALLDGRARQRVESKIIDNQLTLSLEVKVQYGQNVNEVSESLQNKIVQMIEHMTGFRCLAVEVRVVGFYFNAQ